MLFASTLDHFTTIPDRFDGGSGMTTIADPTPRARGRVLEFIATEFGHDLVAMQVARPPYLDDGGYALLSVGARIYLDSAGSPEVNLDFRGGSADSAVLCTFSENSVLITIDGDEEEATSHAIPLPLDTWKTINLLCWLNGAGASWIVVFVDGTAARNGASDYDYATFTATFGGAETTFTSYAWWGADAYGDDFMVSNTEFILGCEGYCAMPTSNGLTVEDDPDDFGTTGRWECSAGATMWSLVDESPTPSTTDSITALGDDYEQYFETGAGALIPTQVNALPTAVFLVNSVILVKGSEIQPDPYAGGFDPEEHPEWREIAPALNLGDFSGGPWAYMPDTTWRYYDGPTTTTPGAAPWTRPLAAATQVGVDANAGSGLGMHQVPYENDIDVAQVALEIYVMAGVAPPDDDQLVIIA